jgi:hypothetical protein
VIWPLLATVTVLGGASLLASLTWCWKLVGPSDDPKPFDPLYLDVRTAVAGCLLVLIPAALAAAQLTALAWWWASAAAMAVVLSKPLVSVGRISAEVYAAELEVSRTGGAISGHGDAHSVVGVVEGRLLRAGLMARSGGDAVLAERLHALAGRVREAERAAAQRRDIDASTSEEVDLLLQMLRAVRLRPNRQFSEPENMPARWPGWLKQAWRPCARRLDAIRAIHTHQIEWVALYALLWLRPILVLALPVLPTWMTAGVRPVTETGLFGDVVWALALATAAGVAVAAPKIVPILQDKTVEHIPLCSRLLLVETPIWALLTVTAPSWVAWSFGAMTFTCAERPGWSTRNAVVIAVGGSATLLATLLARGAGLGDAVLEWLAAVVLLVLISSSYGLLLPLVLDRLLFAGRRAKVAQRRLERAIADGAEGEVRQAAAEASRIVRAAKMSGPEAEAVHAIAAPRPSASRYRLWPRTHTLGEIVLDAAVPLVPSDTPGARLMPIRYQPDGLGEFVVRPSHRRTLERVVKAMLAEADRHGVDGISVTVAREPEQLRIRVVNRRDPASPRGEGEGTGIIETELGGLPGGRLAGPPGLQRLRDRGVAREFWVAEVLCSAEILA